MSNIKSTKLYQIQTEEQLIEFVENNAKILFPSNKYPHRWRCSQCYNVGKHTGYHYKDMLKEIMIDANLAEELKNKAIEISPEKYYGQLFIIWIKYKTTYPKIEQWISCFSTPYQKSIAALNVIKLEK